MEHLPDVLDARVGESVRILDAGPACRYLHRLAALHTTLTDAAARSDQYRVRRALQTDTTSCSTRQTFSNAVTPAPSPVCSSPGSD
ncbi:hypothetical protein [Streptomyces sp. SudanB66_2053]|uniref:hypothetical protein n=1 Tax=Streptomyces sp. SudanB66_2053 TaxID=3035277 RepID=UPI003F54FD2D